MDNIPESKADCKEGNCAADSYRSGDKASDIATAWRLSDTGEKMHLSSLTCFYRKIVHCKKAVCLFMFRGECVSFALEII